MIANSCLLRQHKQSDTLIASEIKKVDDFARKSSGIRNERAVDEWLELLHGSTYQSAAHSMAALGMLAPLLESLFYQAFQGIRASYYKDGVIPDHVRSRMAKIDHCWDCHFLYSRNAKDSAQKDLVPGILELADAVGLAPHLPGDLRPILNAVFRYRNKMFHFGFEWPPKECSKFAKNIANEGWDAWF